MPLLIASLYKNLAILLPPNTTIFRCNTDEKLQS